MSANFALNELIVIINQEVKICKSKLEIEESGREIASLQGHVVGYRKLISWLCANFHFTQDFVEDKGENPLMIPELTDESLAVLSLEINWLQEISEEWKGVMQRSKENVEALKNELLYSAEKTRDLDHCQGQFKATQIYATFFNSVENEIARRQKEKEKRQKEPEFAFQEGD